MKAHQRAESIGAIAIIDNGSGMIPKMAEYALSWGSGTHFDEPDFIGKFGFGLPNASINEPVGGSLHQNRRSNCHHEGVARRPRRQGSRSAANPRPVEAELPDFVQAYLDKKGLPFDHGERSSSG